MHSMVYFKRNNQMFICANIFNQVFFCFVLEVFKLKLKSLPQDKQSLEELVGV